MAKLPPKNMYRRDSGSCETSKPNCSPTFVVVLEVDYFSKSFTHRRPRARTRRTWHLESLLSAAPRSETIDKTSASVSLTLMERLYKRSRVPTKTCAPYATYLVVVRMRLACAGDQFHRFSTQFLRHLAVLQKTPVGADRGSRGRRCTTIRTARLHRPYNNTSRTPV